MPGKDISCYKNIPAPTFHMAITSRYNFTGGYEHDTQGGLLPCREAGMVKNATKEAVTGLEEKDRS